MKRWFLFLVFTIDYTEFTEEYRKTNSGEYFIAGSSFSHWSPEWGSNANYWYGILVKALSSLQAKKNKQKKQQTNANMTNTNVTGMHTRIPPLLTI